MKLSPTMEKIVAALLEGPVETEALRKAAGLNTVETLRVHMARLRKRLPEGGVNAIHLYALNDAARAVLNHQKEEAA